MPRWRGWRAGSYHPRKEGAPLIRYRTHDLTRIIPGDCACGMKHPRIDTLVGRTDDMFKVKGVNMFPAQVEEVIAATSGTSSEYQVMIEHIMGRDVLTVLFETSLEGEALQRCERRAGAHLQGKDRLHSRCQGCAYRRASPLREKDPAHLRQSLLGFTNAAPHGRRFLWRRLGVLLGAERCAASDWGLWTENDLPVMATRTLQKGACWLRLFLPC